VLELTKVSIYVNDSVWIKFKEKVFQKHGNLRKLSSEVEKLLQDAVVETAVISEFEKLGVKVKGTISSQDIKAKRPALRGLPSVDVLKEMRRKRVAQALPRQ
jgi:rRNA-processing protein FCF1